MLSPDVLLDDFAVDHDQLPVRVSKCGEEIKTAVQDEVRIHNDLEAEKDSLRGGLEAHAVRNEEYLVYDEHNAEQDPFMEPRVVRVHYRDVAPAEPSDVEDLGCK